MSDPKIVCSLELPPLVRERLLRVGTGELAARKYDGQEVVTSAYFGLCPICLAPTWKSSTWNETTEPTVHASVDHTELCVVCEDVRHRNPDVFRWVVYVLGARGVIGGESQ